MATKIDVPQSGKVGTTVNVKSRYGQIERQYVIPKDPKTPAQMRIRSNLGRIAPRWRVLEQEQRNAWMLAGQDADTRHRLGRSVPLTGFQFFLKINCSRAAIGLDQFVTPPPVHGRVRRRSVQPGKIIHPALQHPRLPAQPG
jgi:hypothetical protein